MARRSFLPKLNSVLDQRSAFPLLTLVWVRLLCELAYTVHGCVLGLMQAAVRLKVIDTNTDNRTVSPTWSLAQFISYHKTCIPIHMSVCMCVPSKHNFLYQIKVHGVILHSDPGDRQLRDGNRKDWNAKKKKMTPSHKSADVYHLGFTE